MKFKDKSELPAAGNQDFVSIKDGEKVKGIFLGEPYEFLQVWDGKKGGKKDIFPIGANTQGAKFRFRVNFIVKEGTGYVAKILEQGRQVYDQMIGLNEKFGGKIENVVCQISRIGSGPFDTEYHVDTVQDPKDPMRTMPVPPQALAVKLLDLSHENDSKPAQSAPYQDFGPPPPDMGDEEIPF